MLELLMPGPGADKGTTGPDLLLRFITVAKSDPFAELSRFLEQSYR